MFRYKGMESPRFKMVGEAENRPPALTNVRSTVQTTRAVLIAIGRPVISAIRV